MFIETFITYLRVERGSSPHTLKAYETDLRDYVEYLKGIDETLTLTDSDRDLVRGWMAKMMVNSLPEEKRPAACIGCRNCEKLCPQQIKISEIMKDFAGKLA